MCQLLGVSSAHPNTFSDTLLHPFVQRGGNTDVHAHGWGLAYYQYCTGKSISTTSTSSPSSSSSSSSQLRTIRDVSPAAHSPLAQELVQQSQCGKLETRNMIAHIRYATAGEVSIQNVHPFQRELWGIEWVFAHNGDVPLFKNNNDVWLGYIPGQPRFKAEGNTDSEKVFCAILNALAVKYTTLPSITELFSTIQELCMQIILSSSTNQEEEEPTILNFLLGCGEGIQFAYSWPGKRPGSKVWNGLYVKYMGSSSIVATKPLDNDNTSWQEVNRGDLLLFCGGQQVIPSSSFSDAATVATNVTNSVANLLLSTVLQ